MCENAEKAIIVSLQISLICNKHFLLFFIPANLCEFCEVWTYLTAYPVKLKNNKQLTKCNGLRATIVADKLSSLMTIVDKSKIISFPASIVHLFWQKIEKEIWQEKK
jgi:hypothetical protein